VKLFLKNVGGTLRPHGRLVAEKIPRGQSEATEVRVADDSAAPRSSSASVVGDQTRFTLNGRPPRGREGEPLAAGHVLEVLNASGGRWGAPQAGDEDAPHDAIAMDPDGKKLFLQITRVERASIWRVLGATAKRLLGSGAASGVGNPDESRTFFGQPPSTRARNVTRTSC
jgi:hypothetical protein